MVLTVVAPGSIHPASAHHAGVLVENLRIAGKKALGRQRVAVQKKHIIVACILQKQVPYPGTANILLQFDISAHVAQGFVGVAETLVGVVVYAHNLAFNTRMCRLFSKAANGVAHVAVVYGDADGNHVVVYCSLIC